CPVLSGVPAAVCRARCRHPHHALFISGAGIHLQRHTLLPGPGVMRLGPDGETAPQLLIHNGLSARDRSHVYRPGIAPGFGEASRPVTTSGPGAQAVTAGRACFNAPSSVAAAEGSVPRNSARFSFSRRTRLAAP